MSWEAFIGGGLGLLGSLFSSGQNRSSARASMDFQRQVMQNRYQWQVKDLRKAGINPILATGLNAGTAPGATYTTENPGIAAMQSASAAKQINIAERRQRNEDAVAASEVELNSAKKAKEEAEALDLAARTNSGFYVSQAEMFGSSSKEMLARIGYMGYQVKLIEQNIVESKKNVERLEAQIKVEQQRILNLKQDVAESKTRQQRDVAQAALANAQAVLSKMETSLTGEKVKTQKLVTDREAVEVQLRRLGLPYAKNRAFYEDTSVGRFLGRYSPKLSDVIGLGNLMSR